LGALDASLAKLQLPDDLFVLQLGGQLEGVRQIDTRSQLHRLGFHLERPSGASLGRESATHRAVQGYLERHITATGKLFQLRGDVWIKGNSGANRHNNAIIAASRVLSRCVF
jgi:hypothetical protein